jgi:hypothetical protein
VLVVVLVASALKLLGVATEIVGAFLALAAAAAAITLYRVRARASDGVPASTRSTSPAGSGRE